MQTLKEYETLMTELTNAETALIDAGNADDTRKAEKTSEIITSASNNLRVVGINAAQPAHQGIEPISKILGGGGSVTFMTLDPFKKIFAEREIWEKTVLGRLQTEWNAAITDLADAYKRADMSGDLAVNLHNYWPMFSLVSSETGTDDGCMQLNLYPDKKGQRGLTGKTFSLSATGDVNGEQAVYGACVDLLNALGNYSEKITPDQFAEVLDRSHRKWLKKYGIQED